MRQGSGEFRVGRFVAPAAALLLSAGMSWSALAQPEGAPDGEKAPKPLLSGPPVEEGPPGVMEGFGEGAPGRMMAREALPARVLNRILEEMMGEDVAEDVRLTEEQRETVGALREAFEEERRGYMREHADELRELRRRGNVGEAESDRPRGPRARRGEVEGQERPERGRQRGPEGMDEGGPGAPRGDAPMDREREPTPEQNAARQRLREVMAGAPGAEKLYADVWEILTEPQRAHVQGQVDRFHEQLAERRREQYVEREMRERRGREGGDEAGRPGPGARRPMANPEARRERLIEIFNSMSPEEQVQLIDRLERAMADRRSERRGLRGPADKPPPGVDGVNVPPPEDRPERRRGRDE